MRTDTRVVGGVERRPCGENTTRRQATEYSSSRAQHGWSAAPVLSPLLPRSLLTLATPIPIRKGWPGRRLARMFGDYRICFPLFGVAGKFATERLKGKFPEGGG